MSAEGQPEAKRPLIAGLIVGSYALYIAFSRIIPRESFGLLLAGFSLLFLLYFFLLRNRGHFSFRQILLVALLLRVAFVVSVPVLSDDFYRFSWDGRMWWEGMHPLDGTPNELIAEGKGELIDPTGELRSGLNSPDYDTVYPPVSQFSTPSPLDCLERVWPRKSSCSMFC